MEITLLLLCHKKHNLCHVQYSGNLAKTILCRWKQLCPGSGSPASFGVLSSGISRVLRFWIKGLRAGTVLRTDDLKTERALPFRPVLWLPQTLTCEL